MRTALFGHGFVDLPPNCWVADRAEYRTTLALGRRAADIVVCQRGSVLDVRVSSFGQLGSADRASVRRALLRMLRLDEDFSGFHASCRGHPELAWVARRHAGILLRCPTPFEDLCKVLFTTNCSWSNTRTMVSRMTGLLGAETPSGARAFPSARSVGRCSEAQLKQEIRVGYRAGALAALARRFASPPHVRRFEALSRSEQSLREYVSALPGFGPYATGQVLRLFGHYRDFALDSWCMATLKKRGFRASSCTERALGRRYASFGAYRGLAFWLDLTAPWHGEGPHAAEGVEPLESS